MRVLTGLAYMLLSLGIFSSAYAADGAVAQVRGKAFLTHEGMTEPLKINTPIVLGDRVETKEDSSVQIVFADGTDITIGENGSLELDEFVYDPEAKKLEKARFSILHTAFIYLSGAHDEKDQPDTKVQVDFGSIGIRGTKLYRGMREGQCWIYLEEGAVSVSNKAGVVNLQPGDLTRMGSTTAPPTKAVKWAADDLEWIKAETSIK